MSVESRKLIERRHPEWKAHQIRWRWLLDSYEGGDRYRFAVYGTDSQGLPVRNLVRHKREYPDPHEATDGAYYPIRGTDPNTIATCDDYGLRLARTPVPTFVAEAIEDHISRVYAREITRTGPEKLEVWWEDVTGQGADIDQWMQESVAPLLYLFGMLDVLCDHPPMPSGATVQSQADVIRLGLDGCVARVLLPEQVLDWTIDPRTGEYITVLIDAGDGRFRYWTATESTLYDSRGEVLEIRPHRFGRVPIVRCFDRKKARCEHTGQSRLEAVAERQREYYNRDSELILSDTTQAHPLLQGPEDYVQADGTIPIGPNWLLPKKKNIGTSGASYEGFETVDFSKSGAESIRTNKQDIRDSVDRDFALAKPAGARVAGGGGSGQVVGQSGISKAFDHQSLSNRLARLAATLEHAEDEIAELALTVLTDGQAPEDRPQAGPDEPGETEIRYPRQFSVQDASELAANILQFQAALSAAGHAPESETIALQRLVRVTLLGEDDETYTTLDADIASAVTRLAVIKQQAVQQPTPSPASVKTGLEPGVSTGSASARVTTINP